MDQQLFIQRAIEIHKDKYDYSKVEYINCMTNVTIICNEHGEFIQTPTKHVHRKQGCRTCGIILNAKNKRNTTEQFIQKAKEKHGDKFDYSKVKYITNIQPVIIICNTCKSEYEQKPVNHMNGAGGCNNCFELKRGASQRHTTDIFIANAKKEHGNTYDYSKVEYINSTTPVIIICNIHGDFPQRPGDHTGGHGCSDCRNDKNGRNLRYDTNIFIEKAKKEHGDTYDYSKVEYITHDQEVIIICNIHGEFPQKPVNHLQGHGCIKCGGKLIWNTNDFIEKSKKTHGDTYNYSKVEYINSTTNVIIICNKHGGFPQLPGDHMNGHGCNYCKYELIGNLKRYSNDDFITKAREIHRDKYDYSKVEYIDSNTDVIIICNKHGKFPQAPVKHLAGHGCSLCVNKTEAKLYEQLKPIYQTLVTQFKKDWCKKISYLPFDFCIPEEKIIIELDGRQHFQQVSNWSSPEEQFENDKYKETCANENGYSVIRLLQEDVKNDKYKWLTELCNAIKQIRETQIITNIYLCKNDEYTQFMALNI